MKYLPRGLFPRLLNYLWAALGTLAAAALFYVFRGYVDKKHDETLLFLPVVIACAVRLGFGPALLASGLSFVYWDYFFIPPQFALTMDKPRDCVDLVIFLIAAVTTAQLAAQARQKADQAETREREIATLFRIGQIVSSEVDSDRLLFTMADQFAQTCRATRCVVYRLCEDREVLLPAASAPGKPAVDDSASEQSIHQFADRALRSDHMIGFGDEPGPPLGVFVPLRDQDAAVGVLYIGPRIDGEGLDPRDENLVAALGNYAAAVIARQNIADQARRKVQQAAIFEERNRLAREIHDTLAQGLTGIVIQLQAADAGTPADHQAALIQAKSLAEQCLTEARRSVKALRPGVLEGRDLPGAISESLLQATHHMALRGCFRTEGVPFALPAEIDANLLRIAQEAVTNAIRHSRAGEIHVTLAYEPSAVLLSIQDDGCGFDASGSQSSSGFGLTSMRERAFHIGANIDIVSEADEGTSVTVTVNISAIPGAGPLQVRTMSSKDA